MSDLMARPTRPAVAGERAKHPRTLRPVAELVARQAAAQPAAVALRCGGETLTYGELDRRANRLAHRLRRAGVGPEVQVALAMERGPDCIVALLAIARAGGAYVPLDPDYPRSRLEVMVAAMRPALLVAERALVERLPAPAVPVIVPAEERELLAGLPATPPDLGLASELQLDTLAYVNFTSGSTGRPKGVAVTHRGVARLVAELSAADDYARLGPGDVVLHFAPLAFDAATFEIWGALANGARLEVLPPGRPSLDALARHVAEAGVTVLWLTAGLFHQLADSHPQAFAGVRQLLSGGDVLSVPHVRQALAAVGGVVVNAYGPTESTTFTTCHRMAPGELDADGAAATVPIGRPIRRTRVELLSPSGEPLGGAAEGQLAIGGDGLARGYLGRPAATAAAFVPDPAAGQGDGEPGARLYLSGDLARRRADGVYEFLGRLDDQVKVRGFRVEPGEIESTLAAHPVVRQAVVLAEPDPAGGRRLVAFVAAAASAGALPPSAEELRAFVAERLPAPMVPATFEVLAELPLNANGKVDRGALRQRLAEVRRRGERPALAAPYVAPRTASEAAVAEVWADLLGIASVGVEDDLFELGGHSLLATRILARLRQRFGVDVPLEAIFAEPTVAALAARLEAAERPGRRGRSGGARPAARRAPAAAPAPLAFPQRRVWFLQKLEPRQPGLHLPGRAALARPVRVAAFHAAVQAVVARHEVLRTAFPARGGDPVQEVWPPLAVRLPRVDLAALPAGRRDGERRRAMRRVYMRPFDLERPPLIGWVVFRHAADDHAVLHREHHLIHDGWGFNVLLEELSELYTAAARRAAGGAAGAAHPVRRLRPLAGGGGGGRRDRPPARLLAAAAHRQPAAARAALRPAAAGGADASAARRCAPSCRASWRPRCAPCRGSSGATLYQALCAAFLALLARYTGETDVSLGAGVANRRFAATERLLGMVVNTVVLRNDLSGDPPFADAARAGARRHPRGVGAPGRAAGARRRGGAPGPRRELQPAVPGRLPLPRLAAVRPRAARRRPRRHPRPAQRLGEVRPQRHLHPAARAEDRLPRTQRRRRWSCSGSTAPTSSTRPPCAACWTITGACSPAWWRRRRRGCRACRCSAATS